MDDDLVRVAGYSTLDAANDTVRELVVHGIGATAGGPEPSKDSDDSDDEQPYSVLVVATERRRAREILGLMDEREEELANIERAKSTALPLKLLIPLMVGAVILIPALAFYVSFKVSGG